MKAWAIREDNSKMNCQVYETKPTIEDLADWQDITEDDTCSIVEIDAEWRDDDGRKYLYPL